MTELFVYNINQSLSHIVPKCCDYVVIFKGVTGVNQRMRHFLPMLLKEKGITDVTIGVPLHYFCIATEERSRSIQL